MKKKRAFLLFGSLMVLLSGYAAWCGRSMFMRVEVPELTELPEDLRDEARRIVVERGLTRPDPFHFATLVGLLTTPYDSAAWPIKVKYERRILSVRRVRRNYRPEEGSVLFIMEERKWRVMAEGNPFDVELERELGAK